MFNTTPVFLANYNAKEKVVINQGGTSSSKTYSIIQLLFIRAIESKKVITVTGETIPNLKKGAYRDAQNILHANPVLSNYIKNWNQTDRIIYFINGSVMEFVTNENEQSAKSGKRDMLFVNEANGISYSIFWQLAIRTTGQIFIDYNPNAGFWAHEKLIGTDENTNDLSASVKLIISDHRHNTFLSEEQHRAIESIQDPDRWRVYARGLTGNPGTLCIRSWHEIESIPFENCDSISFGVDWGWTNDPTVIAKIGVNLNDRELYVDECFYKPLGKDSEYRDLLPKVFEANGYVSGQLVVADHSRPDMAYLNSKGIYITPAKKPEGSIQSGIMLLNSFKIFITKRSINAKKEANNYQWVTYGEVVTNTPLQNGYDHFWDAVRYPVFTQYYGI